MNSLLQAFFIIVLSTLLNVQLSNSQKDKYTDDNRPYEFSFTIQNEQHRFEKKDVNGIIDGEFGFITGDGVYHVSVYATDENGSFKILSMKNIKISGPLDQLAGGIKSIQQNNIQQYTKSNNLRLEQTTSRSFIPTTSKAYSLRTVSTIRPGCGGCGIVAKPTTTSSPSQTQFGNYNKPERVQSLNVFNQPERPLNKITQSVGNQLVSKPFSASKDTESYKPSNFPQSNPAYTPSFTSAQPQSRFFSSINTPSVAKTNPPQNFFTSSKLSSYNSPTVTQSQYNPSPASKITPAPLSFFTSSQPSRLSSYNPPSAKSPQSFFTSSQPNPPSVTKISQAPPSFSISRKPKSFNPPPAAEITQGPQSFFTSSQPNVYNPPSASKISQTPQSFFTSSQPSRPSSYNPPPVKSPQSFFTSSQPNPPSVAKIIQAPPSFSISNKPNSFNPPPAAKITQAPQSFFTSSQPNVYNPPSAPKITQAPQSFFSSNRPSVNNPATPVKSFSISSQPNPPSEPQTFFTTRKPSIYDQPQNDSPQTYFTSNKPTVFNTPSIKSKNEPLTTFTSKPATLTLKPNNEPQTLFTSTRPSSFNPANFTLEKVNTPKPLSLFNKPTLNNIPSVSKTQTNYPSSVPQYDFPKVISTTKKSTSLHSPSVFRTGRENDLDSNNFVPETPNLEHTNSSPRRLPQARNSKSLNTSRGNKRFKLDNIDTPTTSLPNTASSYHNLAKKSTSPPLETSITHTRNQPTVSKISLQNTLSSTTVVPDTHETLINQPKDFSKTLRVTRTPTILNTTPTPTSSTPKLYNTLSTMPEISKTNINSNSRRLETPYRPNLVQPVQEVPNRKIYVQPQQSPIAKAENGNIYVSGKQTIPIKDKYPNMHEGLPRGITEGDIVGLLYKFNYTVGFHGHYEKGWKNGTKVGGYYVNGRDGYSRIVTYVADENGYRPKFRLINLGINSRDTPKPDSEKTFGLQTFEFVWYPIQ